MNDPSDLPAEKMAALAEALAGRMSPGTSGRYISPYGVVPTMLAAAIAPLIAGWLAEERRAAQVPAVFVADDHEECDRRLAAAEAAVARVRALADEWATEGHALLPVRDPHSSDFADDLRDALDGDA